MQVVIDSTGLVRCLYDEELDLSCLGNLTIARASHVEPAKDGSWYADLSPVNGPVLGPFQRRSQALRAEVQWLECNWLVVAGLEPSSSSASAA
jgi:hypothetical protein